MTNQVTSDQVVQASIEDLFRLLTKEEILLHLCRSLCLTHENDGDKNTSFVLATLAEHVYNLPVPEHKKRKN